jgi:hypothetical protein
MGKAAESEKLKLRATFLNNIATSFLITGFVVPYFAWMTALHTPVNEDSDAAAGLVLGKMVEPLRADLPLHRQAHSSSSGCAQHGISCRCCCSSYDGPAGFE